MTDFFDRPQNEKRSPRPKQVNSNHEQCPTHQNSPTHTPKSSVSTTPPAKPIDMKFGGSSQTKEECSVDGQLVSEGSHPGWHLETTTSMS